MQNIVCNLRTNTEKITAGTEQTNDGQKNKTLNTKQAIEIPRKLRPVALGWPLTTTARGCCTTTCMNVISVMDITNSIIMINK